MGYFILSRHVHYSLDYARKVTKVKAMHERDYCCRCPMSVGDLSLVVGERRISEGMLSDRWEILDNEPGKFDFAFFFRLSAVLAPDELSEDVEVCFWASSASPLWRNHLKLQRKLEMGKKPHCWDSVLFGSVRFRFFAAIRKIAFYMMPNFTETYQNSGGLPVSSGIMCQQCP